MVSLRMSEIRIVGITYGAWPLTDPSVKVERAVSEVLC